MKAKGFKGQAPAIGKQFQEDQADFIDSKLDKPAPATAEWTVNEHPTGYVIVSGEREIARFIKQFCPQGEIQKVCDAHNAELATERVKLEQAQQEILTLRIGTTLESVLLVNQQLREQLDAARAALRFVAEKEPKIKGQQ